MDSDDNCLIIDESETSVISTIQDQYESDENNYQNRNGNQKESETSTPRLHEEINTPRSKERNHNEKSKTKDKVKSATSTPTKDKKRISSTRAHYIRLSSSVLKEKKLNITAYKHQLYNMNFWLKGNMLIGETPSVYPIPPPFPDINLTQLLHWPGIKINISLDHFAFSHETKDNCERDIVFGDDILVNIDKDMNPPETRYVQQVPSSKTYAMVSKEMMETYITALMQVAPQYDVPQSKLPEIVKSFTMIIEDISTVPFSSIQTRMKHSRFLNGQKYFRIFDNGSPFNSNNKNNLKVRLRETINPEVNFWIPQCQFTSDQINVWYQSMDDYFDMVFIKRSMAVRELLRDRFKKCLTLKCEKCNETFDGALWSVKLKDHIKQKHFVSNEWTCVKCLRSWNQFELLQMGWQHNCATGN